jgi:hypothetical protein
VVHIGFFPALVRSKHMSHFCICWILSSMRGTPNGHANSQLRQAMHRGLRLEWTTPLPSTLIASAGHERAQVGTLQCMQTMGDVWGVRPGSTSSTWIIGDPRCVPHSAQPAAHA